MIKQYLSRGFLYFIYIFASLWISLIISLPSVLLSRFKFPMRSVEEYIILTVIMTIVMCFSMYFFTRKLGYGDREFNLKEIFIPLAFAVILQFIYAAIFRFMIYTSGPAYLVGNICYILQGGTDNSAPSEFVFPWMFVFDVLYTGVAVLGNYRGVRKREKDRDKLLSEKK